MSEQKRVALIAGASGGIGGETARTLAREGYDLALSYRSNDEAAAKIAAEVEELGATARTYKATLYKYAEVKAMVDHVVADFDRIDATIYAAGPYLPQRWVTEFDPAEMDDILRDDTVSCWNLLHASVPALRETEGAIVSVSTPAVRRHARKDLLSSVPKAAIEALIRAVASEEGRFGVRANAVAVGALEDGMYHRLLAEEDFDERWIEVTKSVVALGRLGKATDIAEAISFLVSPERAGYVSGQTLTVDGGYAL
ncbi:MAG: SDR family oxidoreductase [Actinobacteria bacterium]|nr:SDR family oxidoreductase [Actinomycetota bacterium]